MLEVDGHRYAECATCALISLDPAQRLTPLGEVMRYAEHRNLDDDERYADFLRRLVDPVQQRLPPGVRGLDFGCGPTPLIGRLLSEAGFPTASFDPVFAPDESLLNARYDFITCSEVVEHLYTPAETFAQFGTMLAGGGLLGVMTRFHGVEAPFHAWWYRRDPTHVCFYAERTMRWIADRHGWTLDIPRPHVALFGVPCA